MSPALDAVLPGARFAERHRRTVGVSPEATWDAVLHCTGREIRALGPLMAIRMLPAALAGRRGDGPAASDPRPILSVFADAGWTWAGRDERPDGGAASLAMVAVGRFWSPTGYQPVPIDSVEAFEAFSTPGYVKAGFELAVAPHPEGTLVTTETRVAPTDRRAARAFGAYWVLIRMPSGLIRRSWLAAIARRAAAEPTGAGPAGSDPSAV